MTGDNSLMIAIAGYMQSRTKKKFSKTILAQGNLQLGN